ncbi:unnamed protein product [Heligmosomoides polygyrus]|uniref:Conserved secreted protein n=1 Tax=Heligmosomoides polygyrus TaxID=6339 RepID=A0A183F6X6_HELPZ|nr:unnamed protein product [Heligmosomoides polygyrus]
MRTFTLLLVAILVAAICASAIPPYRKRNGPIDWDEYYNPFDRYYRVDYGTVVQPMGRGGYRIFVIAPDGTYRRVTRYGRILDTTHYIIHENQIVNN